MKENVNQAGKGSKPRNCFSKKFKDNYDEIDWGKPKNKLNENKSDTSDTKQQIS
jgi:hypothetical protein